MPSRIRRVKIDHNLCMVDPFEWLYERLGADPVAPNGESVLAHARGTAEVLRGLAADETTLTAAALFG
ncbi:MAG: HD domain-containing protein, partial [Betaproteobacteria bacterium]|nr:HD domain-containing protein [Betaproteobacteria bacterium]